MVSATGLKLPEDLTARGFAVRGESDTDRPALELLYIADRWAELAHTDWTDAAKTAFLADQARLQRVHYAACYPGADRLVLKHHGAPVGRLCLAREAANWRIVDILLAPQLRNGGIGTALLRVICADAAMNGASVSIHVMASNPALRLYRRLGFRKVTQDSLYWAMEWRAASPA
ncbi:Mycothiol acetyltransferase [Blastochloris viridis]|uniref:Acetyltransferase n=2 Tax=Blastochloris viridis TaxID=1079 RepID=A0A0H5BEM9_BLAVI|nr:Mycothiol acetyltransferase [Blastochloris viridis]BAS00676.1 acetyltransferase [Blastochloris viridis]CUU42106.1 putative acetyltransferase [Blastochloris viridis]